MFLKSLGAFQGPNDDVRSSRAAPRRPTGRSNSAIVIGTTASYVPEHEAMNHVAGYCVVNDVSEREFQIERGGTWDKGKGCDTFGPTGPWMVTKDEVPDPQNLAAVVRRGRQRMQDGTTKTMIFGVAKLVSYCQPLHVTLHAGRHHRHRHAAGRGPGQEARRRSSSRSARP